MRLFHGQFLLPKHLRAGPLAICDCFDSCPDTERCNHPQNLRRDRGIDAHVAKRDTIGAPPVLVAGVIAHISSDATKPVVQHFELAPAVTAPQEPDQQSATVAHRSLDHLTLHVGVAADGLLIALIVLPGDVTFVVVTNQHLPRLLRPAHAALDHFAACLDANLRASSTNA